MGDVYGQNVASEGLRDIGHEHSSTPGLTGNCTSHRNPAPTRGDDTLNILRSYRRTAAVAVVWLGAVLAFQVASPAASGQASSDAGLGSAYAQGVKVDPRTGRLSFGITYGMALSGHQNTVAAAESRSVDLGVIGTTLAGEGCDGGEPTLAKEDQPEPLVARSTDEGAGVEKVDYEYGVDKRALATDEPVARAVALTSGRVEDGVISIGSVRAETQSGLIDGARVAKAVSQVGYVELVGGAVVLRGLRWEAIYQTAPEELISGSFTMEGIEILGREDATYGDDPISSIAEANAVLSELGIVISPPKVRVDAGIQFVDPMKISIVPNDNRDQVAGAVLNAVAPVRESVFDAIIEADCSNASYITVLDIVLGSITGAGSLSIEVGGVTASSRELVRSSFLNGGGAPSTGGSGVPTGSSGFVPPASGGSSSFTPRTPVDTASPAAPTVATTAPALEDVAIGDVSTASGSRGGWLAAVGLLGLVALSFFALADSRRLRRARRFAPMGV